MDWSPHIQNIWSSWHSWEPSHLWFWARLNLHFLSSGLYKVSLRYHAKPKTPLVNTIWTLFKVYTFGRNHQLWIKAEYSFQRQCGRSKRTRSIDSYPNTPPILPACQDLTFLWCFDVLHHMETYNDSLIFFDEFSPVKYFFLKFKFL